jgi:hypothetical protein
MGRLLKIATRKAGLGLGAAFVVIAVLACGGQQVEPLDPRDLTLPLETRRWIAAAEDGVVVARARRDAAKEQLNRVRTHQERALDEIDFGARGTKVIDTMAARFERLNAYLGVQLERTEAELALAEAKYDLATAEQAMLHDLASYDLEEIKNRVEQVRRRVHGTKEQLRKTRDALDRTTAAFWQVYSQYLKEGGETLPFWIGKGSSISIAKTASNPSTNSKPELQGPNTRSNVDQKELPSNPF